MKTKKINKKLSFSKRTIADLNSQKLNVVRGGTLSINCPTVFAYTCLNTCPATCPATCDDRTCFHRDGTDCPY